MRTPALATISRLVQLPSAPALLLRSTATAAVAAASASGSLPVVIAAERSGPEAEAESESEGGTLLEHLVVACLGALEGFEAGSEAMQALNEAALKLEGASERARLGAARSSLIRAHPAMEVIKRALLLLVASIGDQPTAAAAAADTHTGPTLAGAVIGRLVRRICALLRQPSCSTACRCLLQ